jgi:hypothetical protein
VIANERQRPIQEEIPAAMPAPAEVTAAVESAPTIKPTASKAVPAVESATAKAAVNAEAAAAEPPAAEMSPASEAAAGKTTAAPAHVRDRVLHVTRRSQSSRRRPHRLAQSGKRVDAAGDRADSKQSR